MNQMVTWTPSADDDLAALWIEANDRQAVTAASHRIEQVLRFTPEAGQDYYGDWLHVDLPLAVVYSIVPEDRIVWGDTSPMGAWTGVKSLNALKATR